MYYLFLITLFFANSSLPNEFISNDNRFRVTFCNVGQGNCTLFKFPEGPPLIVDAGSAALPKCKTDPKEYISKELVEHISQWIDYKESLMKNEPYPDLNIIISHGDNDHYSWIVHIIKVTLHKLYNINKEKSKNIQIKIKCLLGGNIGDYPKSLISQIKQWHNYPVPMFVEEYWGEPHIYCGEGVQCHILSMLTGDFDKNSKSIVLKISYDERSVLLTGDATGITTKNIWGIYDSSKLKTTIIEHINSATNDLEKLQYEYKYLHMHGLFLYNNPKYMKQFISQNLFSKFNNNIENLKLKIEDIRNKILELESTIKRFNATILQASHHGADTEKSNSEEWFQIVSPKFLVFSSGIRMDYLHPKLEVLKRASSLNSIHSTKNWHSCHVYSEEDPMDVVSDNLYNDNLQPYIIFKNGYQVILMKLGIYNTIDQGNITFTWRKGEDIIVQTENHNITPKSQLLHNTMQRMRDNDNIGNIKVINIRNFELDEKSLQDIIKLLPHFKGVRGINISHNNLGPICLKYLPEIINSLPKVYYCDIKNNGLIDADLVTLENHWQNRGLVRNNH